MLARLAGRTHRVLTAVAVGDARHTDWVVQVSRVSFSRLSAAEIDAYVASGEPFDKAGGYGIQGAAGAFVRKIEGSYSGIMGLPLHETARMVHKALARAAAPGASTPLPPMQDPQP
jgi:septum formation protein